MVKWSDFETERSSLEYVCGLFFFFLLHGIVIGADFNGHVGEGNRGEEEVMGRFGIQERRTDGGRLCKKDENDWSEYFPPEATGTYGDL